MAEIDDAGPSRPAEPTSLAAARRRDLNRRLRAAFLAGAEEHSLQSRGRGLTEEELERMLRRYPGNPGERLGLVE